jgi:hypothetical protein
MSAVKRSAGRVQFALREQPQSSCPTASTHCFRVSGAGCRPLASGYQPGGAAHGIGQDGSQSSPFTSVYRLMQ